MQKKLLAVAVAGALFAPVAMAQSSVTISGTFKVGVDNYRVGNPGAARAGLNTSENRVSDQSSQIHFNVTEDLGGGLAAIAKLDIRFQPDDTKNIGTSGSGAAISSTGNTWVGIRSRTLGTLTFGRHDLHYGKQPDEVPVKGSLMASSISIMDYAGGGGTAIANATRTQNVVRWDSPNWSGFNLTVAWSANPSAPEGDLGVSAATATALGTTPAALAAAGTTRKGSAWNFNPSYTTSNWQVGYSYWDSKADGIRPAAPTAAQAAALAVLAAAPFPGPVGSSTAADQRSHVLYGYARLGAFKLGAAWNRAQLKSAITGVESSKRTAWTFPVAWFAGPHTLAATYSRAGDDDAIAGDNKASMLALAYSYDLSKRTAVSLTYARISNNAAAAYNMFTNTETSFGSGNSGVTAGEDPRLISAVIRHSF